MKREHKRMVKAMPGEVLRVGEPLKGLARLCDLLPRKAHLHFSLCWNIRVPSNWVIPTRQIEDQHFLFVRGGSGSYWVDGHEIPLTRGRIVWLTQDVAYRAVQDFDDPPVIIPMRFSLQSNLDGTLEPVAPACGVSLVVRDVQAWEELAAQIPQAWKRGQHNLASSLMHVLFCRLREELERAGEQPALDPRLLAAQEIINADPAERMPVAELAGKVGLSERYFSTLFKEQFGVTPKSYQVQVRMRYARFLLEESKCSVKSVAYELGYPDPFVFSKQFKAVHGCAPSEL